MFAWFFVLLSLLIIYTWFIRSLVIYARAVIAFGFDAVIFIYHPFTSNIKYMKYRNQVDGDSLLEIKRKLQQKPQAKIIIYGYMFYSLQNIIDPAYNKRILSNQFIHHLEKMKFIFGDQYQKNLVFSEEKAWKNSRRIISNVFNFEELKHLEPAIMEIIGGEINGLEEKNVDLYEFGSKIAGKVVIQAMIGKKFENLSFGKLTCLQEANQINRTMVQMTMRPEHMIRYLLTQKQTPYEFLQKEDEKELYRRFANFIQKGKQYLEQEYKLINQENSTSCKFVQVYFKQPNPSDYFQEIVEQILLFLSAGQDTTGNFIESCLTELAKRPQYQQNIIKQYQSSDKNIHNLKLLNNFISQVNRLYGPARNILIRKVVKQFQIDGYTFRKGAFLTAGIGFTMFSPKYFDNPLEFIPERWNTLSEQSVVFIPFSSGPRNCIGQHLAKIEVRMVLIQILKKYKLTRTNVPVSLLSIGNVFYGKAEHNLVNFHLK